jgi:hypothetical protein
MGHFLLLIAEMPNGGRVGRTVEIPDYRKSKEVSVILP